MSDSVDLAEEIAFDTFTSDRHCNHGRCKSILNNNKIDIFQDSRILRPNQFLVCLAAGSIGSRWQQSDHDTGHRWRTHLYSFSSSSFVHLSGKYLSII